MTRDYVRIEKTLNDYGVWANVYEELNMIAVDIEWGDWKHDHLAVKWKMAEMGYKQLFERTTNEDGSDCYSAIHYFVEA